MGTTATADVEAKATQHAIKKQWTTPQIAVIHINAAQGHHAGPLCDKHGSLSGGIEGCPNH